MTSAMRRYANVRAMGHAAPKPITFPDAQGAELLEGYNGLSVQRARRGPYPAGCSTMARTKRTAQAPGRPSPLLDPSRSCGEPVTHLRRTTRCGRTCRRSSWAQNKRPHRGRPLARGTGAVGRRRQGVGGLHRSDDVGERGNARTRPSTGGPCRCELQEGSMSNALTLNDMSPALRKVVETRSHESHRRKSRMREIRSSGSGEGPGWATSRPTLQRP